MDKFRVGEFLIEPQLNNISGNGHAIRVEPKVMQVLICLVDHAGDVVAKEELIRAVWADTFVTDDVLTRSISELRKVFGDQIKQPHYIQTIPRSGYRLIAPIEREDSQIAPIDNSIPVTPRPTFASRTLLWLIVPFLLVSAAALIYFTRTARRNQSPLRIVRFTSFTGREDHAAFSPDGNQIAFAWNGEKGDNVDLYIKSINGDSPLRLTTNPAEDTFPTWSPDGQKIAFIRIIPQELKFMAMVISALGTSPERTLLRLRSEPSALSWSPDGKLIATSDGSPGGNASGIILFSPDTGESRYLTVPPPKYTGDSTPAFSPDGKSLAFIRRNTPITGDIYVVSITGGDPRRVTYDHAQYSQYFFANGIDGGLAWTAEGQELVFSSTRGGTPGLWRVAVSGGEPERLSVGGDDAYFPTISAKGHRMAYTQLSVGTTVYRMGLPNSAAGPASPTKLFASSRLDSDLQYSPDGKKIAFDSDRSGNLEIWICDSDGKNPTQLTTFGKGSAGTPRWSPDGNYIAFDYRASDTADVYVTSVSGGAPRRIVVESSDDSIPSWSQDGNYIYFASSRSGDLQIWKVPVAGGQATQLTRQSGGVSFESQDGKYLYYSGKKGIWRVPVEGGDEELVLDKPYAGIWGCWALVGENIYFMSPAQDGSYFLNLFNIPSQRTSQVAAAPLIRLAYPGLAVSPDQRWILFNEQSPVSGDIMLVENFR